MLPHITKIIIFIFFKQVWLFLAPDGRIIVYGGASDVSGTTLTDNLAILDTTQSPFRWTVPKNNVYPIKKNHFCHTSNLYGNYMITAFGN